MPPLSMEAMLGSNLASSAMTRPDSSSSEKGWVGKLGMLFGCSLFPIAALIIILGTALFTALLGPGWGPFVTLALTYLWWRVATTFG